MARIAMPCETICFANANPMYSWPLIYENATHLRLLKHRPAMFITGEAWLISCGGMADLRLLEPQRLMSIADQAMPMDDQEAACHAVPVDDGSTHASG